MRRLLLLVASLVFVDTILYAAITPLLPRLAHDYGLTKAGAGALVGSYAAGALLGGLPGGIAASRLGPKLTVLVGLGLMGVASLAFAFASTAGELGVARFVQGFGSTLTWAGSLTWLVCATPRERRGELIGSAMGAAILGALLGPVLGAAAGLVGIRPVFCALAALAVVLGTWALRSRDAAADPQPISNLGRAVHDVEIRVGLWLMVVPAFSFGLLAVLAPLALDRGGWGTAAIGAVFLAGAALEATLSPLLGRLSDRTGRLFPLRLGLGAALVVAVLLAAASSAAFVAVLVVFAAVSFGSFWAPAMALISDGAERSGLAQGLAFGLMNAAWAIGNVIGPTGGGLLAKHAGDAASYVVVAALCLVTLAAIRPRAALGELATERGTAG